MQSYRTSATTWPFGRTGQQLYLYDHLLYRLAFQLDELRRFQHRLAFGISATKDLRVHVSSALMNCFAYHPKSAEFAMAVSLQSLGWRCIRLPYEPEPLSWWSAHSQAKRDPRVLEILQSILAVPEISGTE